MIPEKVVDELSKMVREVCETYDPGGWTEEKNWAIWTRRILDAASPAIAAQAWDEGAIAGWKQFGEGFNAEYPDESIGECSVDLSVNPYKGSPNGAR